MSLLNKLVEERRKKISQLRGKYEGIPSDAIPNDKLYPEWGYIKVENDSYTGQNDNGDNESEEEEEESNPDKGYGSDVSMSSDEQNEEDHYVSATKDLEIKLKPQMNELQKRTEKALKRILRRNIIQKNVTDVVEEEEESD